jgi:hypothetical protein
MVTMPSRSRGAQDFFNIGGDVEELDGLRGFPGPAAEAAREGPAARKLHQFLQFFPNTPYERCVARFAPFASACTN